ncbi:MAG: phospholipase phosphocholine-specific [Bacteroidetes bacterium]|nr:phospholipase phosphocholine-specific [Bacteroidota bacterium]
MLSAGVGISQFVPASIQKAFAIDPETGSTYLDAEHIVLLMQENRSFDHAYGTLQGVRGFNDPRAIHLPNKNPVWLQTNENGETYAPFRLDIKNSKITWMGSLPHSWDNQVDARNNGKYDKWLQAKKPGDQAYKHMPLTMGYYTREDIPFYYALADAFTVCDHNFCSSLTGTTPNRLHFWTGTIRAEQNENSKANVWNEDADYDTMVSWKTFPERLEENNISWKIYQNDISIDSLMTGEEDYWLNNFTDNPIEFFTQYNVKLSERYINYLEKKAVSLPGEIEALEKRLASMPPSDKDYKNTDGQIKQRKALLEKVSKEKPIYTREKYNQLSQFEKNLHERAFTSNIKDPHYHDLTPLKYKDGDIDREINIPKGDVLYQFREDVEKGKLPTVSWLVAPEAFSDHPGSAWFGAWYVSEVMDILTKNPEVWKKTIFVLTYDENDGYFDHLPPFVAPNPHDASTGKTSAAIDTKVDFVTMEQEKTKAGADKKSLRESSIGLGYRVPMVIASPWSRGGYVNSQVFDHTSSLQFLEKFLSHKTGKKLVEPNISAWRRNICGDLSSAFRPYKGEKLNVPAALNKALFIESIHKAKFKSPPADFKKLSAEEIKAVKTHGRHSADIPAQEKGIRPANALPYEMYADGKLNVNKDSFEIHFDSGKNAFGKKTAGVPFLVYAIHNDDVKVRSYAVLPGDNITDSWHIADFENGNYHLEVHGPNGFFRSFQGNKNDAAIDIACAYKATKLTKGLTGDIEIVLQNNDTATCTIELTDHYTNTTQTKQLAVHTPSLVIFDLAKTYGWYDISVKVKGNSTFEKRYAGKVETGNESFTDPMMGGMVG